MSETSQCGLMSAIRSAMTCTLGRPRVLRKATSWRLRFEGATVS